MQILQPHKPQLRSDPSNISPPNKNNGTSYDLRVQSGGSSELSPQSLRPSQKTLRLMHRPVEHRNCVNGHEEELANRPGPTNRKNSSRDDSKKLRLPI
jgi:hypothetical protein